ncbi:MAG: tetratricopeptide repeat protein, partial [bacterium]|nr:tetratricopeptide repeat protein [bacterium]
MAFFEGAGQDFNQFASKLAPYGETLTPSAPFLASLLSISTEDSRLEQLNAKAISLETKIAFRKLLEALSGRAKLVVVLEDVHWLDDNDRQILKTVAENCITEQPILFILVHRPEKEDGSKIEFKYNSAVTSCNLIKVSEVDEAASRKLVVELLGVLSRTGAESVYEPTVRFLLKRSGGNPFYLEELIFDLVESGVLVEEDRQWKLDVAAKELSVPESLTGLIQSRLDRLPESWKSVLQNSSVLGIEFQLKLYWKLVERLYLSRSHTDAFDGLEQKQMLLSEINALEKKYLFRHILVHDTAYSGIIEANLKKLHRAAAESMEEMFPDELDSISAFLMHHYDKADEKSKAIEWGFKSMKLSVGEEQLKISRRIESLLLEEQSGAQLDESVFKMLSSREKALDTMADREEQQKTIQWMIDLADKTGSDLKMAIALKKQGAMSMTTGNMTEAMKILKRALELARAADDRHFQSIVLGNLGGLLANQGQIEKAVEYFKN